MEKSRHRPATKIIVHPKEKNMQAITQASNRTLWTVVIAVAAFGAGLGAAHFSEPAYAADDIKVVKINLIDLKDDDIS